LKFSIAQVPHDLVRVNATLIEPYYEGTLGQNIVAAPAPVQIMTIGVPHHFLTNYGHQEEHDEAIGLTPAGIKQRIVELIHQS
jgi:deoxyxylulose-5-phosphate synthase